MQDPQGVGRPDPLAEPRQDPCRLGRREGPLPQELSQALALDLLEGQVAQPANLARVVEADHVGVIEAAESLGFDQEALDLLGTVRGLEEGLEGHRALKSAVKGVVDGAHSAPAQEASDQVGAELGADPESAPPARVLART